MNYKGVIIEESLMDTFVLKDVIVVSTQIEPVTSEHKTPWVDQWTMHNVEVPTDRAAEIADRLSKALDPNHNWYADFKTESDHYVVFRNRVFHITDRSDAKQYDEATAYGISLGIPAYQVDFSPHVTQWER